MPAAEAATALSLTSSPDFSKAGTAKCVAVAVSGGSDSVALLMLVHAWAAERDVSVVAVTFDHGLRAEAAEEARWVAGLCQKLGLPHITLTHEGQAPSAGLMAWARACRYDALARWCKQQGIEVLFTGHTLDDQAETVMMRQRRTASDRSLAGIWPEMPWGEIRVVRPLLGISRAALRENLVLQGLDWLEDPSNSNLRFERVRVRAALDPARAGVLADIAISARQRAIQHSQLARDWSAAHVVRHAEGYFSFPKEALAGAGPAPLERVLEALTRALSGRRFKTSAARAAMVAWIGEPGAGRRTACGVVFARREHDVLVGREWGRIEKAGIVLPSSGELLWDHRFLIKAPVGTWVRPAGPGTSTDARLRGVPAFVRSALPVVTGQNGENTPFSAAFCPQLDFS